METTNLRSCRSRERAATRKRDHSSESPFCRLGFCCPVQRRFGSSNRDSRCEFGKALDAPGGSLLGILAGHSYEVTGVAVSRDGRRVVSTAVEGTVKLWDGESGLELLSLHGHGTWALAVALSNDGKRAISAHVKSILKVWDVDRGLELYSLTGYSGGISRAAVALSGDGHRAVFAAYDKTLRVWRAPTKRIRLSFEY
jgi:WD40 repeat protein